MRSCEECSWHRVLGGKDKCLVSWERSPMRLAPVDSVRGSERCKERLAKEERNGSPLHWN